MGPKKAIKRIVIISDGTGKTAQRLLDAILVQYTEQKIKYTIANTFSEVRSQEQIDEIMKKIRKGYLVIFTIISRDLSQHLQNKLKKRGIAHLNVLKPMINTMSKFLGVHPEYRPGLLQIIDDNYYRKIDAIGYTVEHDDGQGHRHGDADLILLGLSRTCKTPLSMYLSCNFGLKVANIPIVPMENIKKHLLELIGPCDQISIVGIIMSDEELLHAREERVTILSSNSSPGSEFNEYLDFEKIRREIRFCRRFYNEYGWPVVNVTKRAIEEISEEIIRVSHLPQSY